jgi:G-patch domain
VLSKADVFFQFVRITDPNNKSRKGSCNILSNVSILYCIRTCYFFNVTTNFTPLNLICNVFQGLGAKQDGMLAPVTLRQKDNQKGVGYEGHDDTWLAHQEDFQVSRTI